MVLQTIVGLCLFFAMYDFFYACCTFTVLPDPHFFDIKFYFPLILRTICSPFGIVMPVHIIHLSTPGN